MPTSGELYNQMQGVQQQLEKMTPANRSAVEQDLMNRVNFFRPQYEELAGMQQAAYSAPARLMQQYQQNYGNVGGPGAMARLSAVLGNIGQQQGTADVLSNVIQTQRGNIADLAGSAVSQYQAQQQALKDRYGMYQTNYQTQLRAEEAQRQREWEALQAQRQREFQAAQARAERAARAAQVARARQASRSSRMNFPRLQSILNKYKQNAINRKYDVERDPNFVGPPTPSWLKRRR